MSEHLWAGFLNGFASHTRIFEPLVFEHWVNDELANFDSTLSAWQSVDHLLCDSLLGAPQLVEEAQKEEAIRRGGSLGGTTTAGATSIGRIRQVA